MVTREDFLRVGTLQEKLAEKTSWLLSQTAVAAANAAISALIFYQVVARYLFNSPPSWTEELARFAMIWMVYLGFVVTFQRGQEITLTGTLRFAGRTLSRWLWVGRDLAVLLFLATLFYESIHLAWFDRTITTAALEISWTWIYLAVTVGVGLYMLAAVPALLRRLAGEPAIAAVEAAVLAAAYLAVTRLGVTELWGIQITWLTPVLLVALMLM